MKHLTAAFLALWLVLGATTHAQALPIGLAIAGALGFAGTAATIVGAVIMGAIGIGLQFVAGALLRKRGSADVGGTTGKMQTGGVVPRSFPFGVKAPVTHSLVYWNSFGQDGKTPNAYVAFVFALSDLPIGGGRAALSELWVNGSKVTWNPATTPGTYGIPISEFNKDSRDHMWVEVHDGTQTTADSFMVSQFSGDANWPYENTRIGTGVAYVRVICRLNRDLFSGYPTFKFVCKGIPFYDVREDTTAGGSGSHRWSTQSTWEQSENPITVAYNLIRGVSYGGAWFFGGQTASASQLPFAAFAAAMNECDATITNEDATTEKQFRCAGEIRLDMEPADVIDDLLRACNGQIGEIGGVYKPYVGAAGVAVLSITDDDIRTDEDQTFEPFFGLQDIVNSINAKYVEPGEGWTAKDAPALIDEDLEAIDGGRLQPVDLQFEYVPFARQVQRQCRAALTDYRRERRHALPLAPEAWRLEPAIDFVSWTSARNGYTAKLFAVTGATDMDGYLVGVSLKEVDPGDYDDVTSLAPTINVPPLVYPQAQGIAGADIDGVTVEGAGGRAKPGALLQWNGEDLDDIRAVAFQIRVDGQTDLTYSGETPESAVASGSYIVTANLNGATAYEGRLRFVPFTGRDTTWSDWIEFTTPDTRVTQGELDTAIQETLDSVEGIATDATNALAEAAAARAEADTIRKALSPIPDIRGTVAGALQVPLYELVNQSSEVLDFVLARILKTDDLLRQATIEVDQASGRVVIRALDKVVSDTATQFNEVSATFDAVNAEIALRATSADLANAITALTNGFTPAYRWEFNGTVEGWTPSNITVTPNTGTATLAATGSPAVWTSPAISFDADANKVLALRIRRTAGTGWGVNLEWGTQSRSIAEPGSPTDWNILRINQDGQAGWTGTLTQLRLTFANGSTFEVDYVEVGNSAIQDLIIGDLEARVGDVEIGLDAANAAISLRATLIQVGAIEDRVSQAELDIDAANARIDLRVTQAERTEDLTRLSTAELELDALQGSYSVVLGEIQTNEDLLAQQAEVDAMNLVGWFNRTQDLDAKVTYASQTLSAQVQENGAAVAQATTDLLALSQSVSAQFSEITTVQTNDRVASASRLEALELAYADPIRGNAALSARYFAEVQARVSADEALATRASVLEATVNSGTDGNLALKARIATEETTRASEDSAIAGTVASLTAVVDTKARTFVQTSAPTATATGDLWVDSDDGNKLYRWSGSAWVSVQDTAYTAKNKVFAQTTAPTATATGDLWVDTDDGNKTYRWNGSSWVDTTDARLTQAMADITSEAVARADADSALTAVQTTHTSQIALRARTFVQTSAPTADNAGDLWFDSDDGFKQYRWSGSAWVSVQDTGKNRTFVQASAPTATATGDLWFDSDDNNRPYRWSGSAWVDITDTRLTTAQADITTLNATKVTESEVNALIASALTARFGAPDDPDRIEAKVEQIFNVTAGPTGASALWSVQLDVDGRVSGLKNLNTGETSAFIIRADLFGIENPDTEELSLYYDTDTNTFVIKNGTLIAAKVTSVSGRMVSDYANEVAYWLDESDEVIVQIGDLDYEP